MTEDDDLDRIKARFVRGEITFNEFIRAMERLASLAKDDDTPNPRTEHDG